jgi:uncharacterized LabA/DUF88 family protein
MNKPKVIIYIDGENFLHRVEDVLRDAKKIKDKSEITKLAVRSLLVEIFPEYSELEIRYYGTKVRIADIEDASILKRAETIAESQRRLKRDLTNQKIDFIISGSLRVRETKCRKCNNTTLVFKEKGVDVRMAVDIIQDANPVTHQIIVSSDSDLLPAINVARHKNKSRLTYVHHAEQANYAMIKATNESRVFTANQILKAYKPSGKGKP